VRVIPENDGPAFTIEQTLLGFGLPGGRLKVVTDPAGNSSPWTYEGRARGTFTDLENTVEIIVRSRNILTLHVLVGEGGNVKVEDSAGRLVVSSDGTIKETKDGQVALPKTFSTAIN
jgi:hypothetical protein